MRGHGRLHIDPLDRTWLRDARPIFRKENVVKGTHTIESKWREADVASLEERIKAISEWLDHTEDLVAMFMDDDVMAQELRSLAGVLRSKKNDIEQKANAIRAELVDQQNGSRG